MEKEGTGFWLEHFRTENQKNPIGLDCEKPRFSWELHSKKESIFQSAYQIKVTDQWGNAKADSGRVESKENVLLSLEHFQPEPMTEYNVHITVWNNLQESAEIEGRFETGKLGTEWKASWIEPEQIPTEDSSKGKTMNRQSLFNDPHKGKERDFAEFQPVQYIRIPFELEKTPVKARIYTTAHGFYRLSLNGSRADEREMTPDLMSYEKILMYQTYDVTERLREGKNVIGVELADGWWSGRTGMSGDSCQFGDTTGLLLEARITFEDGTVQTVSAENGVSHTGPLVRSDIFVGEKYDARLEMPNWDTAEFPADDWKPVKKAEYGFENLIGQYGASVKSVKILQPKEIIRSPKGEYILDVGQIVAGNVEITLDAEAGKTIKLEHSEVLDEEGNYYNNIIGVNKEQQDVYVTKEGKQTYRPHFTWHGFRYVRVTGWPGEMTTENFKIFVLSSEMEDIGTVETSHKELNKLIQNIWWSQVTNTISIPTDCPQRERAGWGGDIMVFATTMCKNRQADAFLTRWMMNVRAEQMEKGEIPNVVPYLKSYKTMANVTTKFHTSCGWGDTVEQVPLTLYREYGDKRVLEENYPAMKRWINYIKERAWNHHPEEYETWDKEHQERSHYLWNTDFHYADWLVPSMVLGNPDGTAMIQTARQTMRYVAPAYFANTAATMAEIAEILGQTEDAKEYRQLYEKIREAFIEEYVSKDGTLEKELQGLYVIALKNHLCQKELQPKMAAHLNEMIQENDNCLDTGFLSVHYLLDVLCENGYRDTAYKILFQTKCPSWLYEVEHGATTMWESWGAIGEDGQVSTYSYNHYAFGCVMDWIYREIGGIKELAPGYESVMICPDMKCGLTDVKCTQHTPNGVLQVVWKVKESKGSIRVKIPCNTKAMICLPTGKCIMTGSGEYQWNFQLNI